MKGAFVTDNEYVADVNTDTFYKWAVKFVEDKKDMGESGHILLSYDGYRAHLSRHVLELFAANKIVP